MKDHNITTTREDLIIILVTVFEFIRTVGYNRMYLKINIKYYVYIYVQSAAEHVNKKQEGRKKQKKNARSVLSAKLHFITNHMRRL